MQYYTFVLDEDLHNLCTFATPFGLYHYCHLPMVVSESPDISTEIMHQVLNGMPDIEFYMEDIGCFSNDWSSHLHLLHKVLTHLQDINFTINLLKCEWAVAETDFLGHWLTPTGIKPWHKKVDAILQLQPPNNIKELCSFLGMVNYYQDMWPQHTHVLTPLTVLMGKGPFCWDAKHQVAFEQMKALVSADTLLAYPNHTKPYDVETDASDYQLGAVIKQHNCPATYYSCKLNSAQQNYSTIEKELLSIIETLKAFHSILLGTIIHVHMDHKNLTHHLTEFTTQHVLCWHLLLEEFQPTLFYKKGPSNILTDALSCVPTSKMERESPRATSMANPALAECLSSYLLLTEFPHSNPNDQAVLANGLPTSMVTSNSYDQVVLANGLPTRMANSNDTPDQTVPHGAKEEVFLEHPIFDNQGHLPFHYSMLYMYQQNSMSLLQLPVQKLDKYELENMGGYLLVCYKQGQHC